MELKKSEIVILALAKWDGAYSSTTFSLAKEFSKSNKVLYIERPNTWKDIFLSICKIKNWRNIKNLCFNKNVKHLNRNLTIYSPSPTIPSNFLPAGKIYTQIKRINEKLLFHSINKVIKDMNFEQYIFINIFNPFFNHIKYLHPKLSIYYTVDNINESWYVKKHGPRLEKELMKQVDLTFATSAMLKKSNLKFTKNLHYLPNAADLEIFNPKTEHEKPKEISHITKETITFIGHLDSRTDLTILKSILTDFPERILLIIGPISLDSSEFIELESFENLLFIDPQSIEKIPGFLKHTQCAIIPYKCNKLTSGIYPLKINEYLAMGIPVVSTPFSEDIEKFKEVISLATTKQEFSQMLDLEIRNDSKIKSDERVKFAQNNSWTNRINEFWYILENHT